MPLPAMLKRPVKKTGATSRLVNSTITAGGTPQTAVASYGARTFLEFQNSSDTAMWITFGTDSTPAAGTGILIAAGLSWRSPNNFCPTDAVKVFCATTGKAYSVLSI